VPVVLPSSGGISRITRLTIYKKDLMATGS